MMERRATGSGPPSIVMQAYREMDPGDQNRLEKVGYGMLGVTAVVVIAGIFYDLAVPYLLFVSGFGVLGACFVFPVLGFSFLDVLLRTAVKLAPSIRERLMPDRRTQEESDTQ